MSVQNILDANNKIQSAYLPSSTNIIATAIPQVYIIPAGTTIIPLIPLFNVEEGQLITISLCFQSQANAPPASGVQIITSFNSFLFPNYTIWGCETATFNQSPVLRDYYSITVSLIVPPGTTQGIIYFYSSAIAPPGGTSIHLFSGLVYSN